MGSPPFDGLGRAATSSRATGRADRRRRARVRAERAAFPSDRRAARSSCGSARDRPRPPRASPPAREIRRHTGRPALPHESRGSPGASRRVRLRGTTSSTRVQAEKQGPSMTTRSPDSRSNSKYFKKDVASPPGLASIRTSASAGLKQGRETRAARRARRIGVRPRCSEETGWKQGRKLDALCGGSRGGVGRRGSVICEQGLVLAQLFRRGETCRRERVGDRRPVLAREVTSNPGGQPAADRDDRSS